METRDDGTTERTRPLANPRGSDLPLLQSRNTQPASNEAAPPVPGSSNPIVDRSRLGGEIPRWRFRIPSKARRDESARAPRGSEEVYKEILSCGGYGCSLTCLSAPGIGPFPPDGPELQPCNVSVTRVSICLQVRNLPSRHGIKPLETSTACGTSGFVLLDKTL